jgi:hypothetical protein
VQHLSGFLFDQFDVSFRSGLRSSSSSMEDGGMCAE